MLVVRAIFDVLSRQNASGVTSDDDIKAIRRTYFQFLHSLVTNNVTQVILRQGRRNFAFFITLLNRLHANGVYI